MIYKHIQDKFKVLLPFIILLLATVPFLFYNKGSIVLNINKEHTPFLDFFFKNMSGVGNALSIFVFLAITLRFKLKYLYFFILAFAIESIFIVLGKKVFFNDVFKEQGILDQINFVEGVKVRKHHSFPSGHTAYSFFVATFFVLKLNKFSYSILLFLIAALIGVSRMYLVQHFFVDVFTGAIVGTLSTFVAYVLVFNQNKKWYHRRLKINFQSNSWITLTND